MSSGFAPVRSAAVGGASLVRRSVGNARLPIRLLPLREQAMQRFLKLGLPTTRDETWRHTNLRALAAQTLRGCAAQDPRRGRTECVARAARASVDRAASLLMVNGYPSMPLADGLINGVEVYSLQEVARIDPDTLLRFQEPLSDADQQRWALAQHGAVRRWSVSQDHRSGCGTAGDPARAQRPTVTGTYRIPAHHHRRAPGSSATIIEHHVAQGAHTPLSNSTTHIALRHDSQARTLPRVLRRAPTPPISIHSTIRQDQGSQCKQFTIVLGGGLVRTTLEAHLE